jgi:hypothetical protein
MISMQECTTHSNSIALFAIAAIAAVAIVAISKPSPPSQLGQYVPRNPPGRASLPSILPYTQEVETSSGELTYLRSPISTSKPSLA